MTRNELQALINEEKRLYFTNDSEYKKMKKNKHKRYYIFKYLYYFRLCQYYYSVRTNKAVSKIQRKLAKYKFRYFDRIKNIYSYKSGVEIGLSSNIGRCCDIWHSGIVINGDIGNNCIFHGNNVVGNKGIGKENLRPIIGNNVDIGVGAVVIGNITVADECVIGAGAVVTKSFCEKESLIVGVPGKRV